MSEPDDKVATGKVRKHNPFNSWHGTPGLNSRESYIKYQQYLIEHKRRLRQLEREAKGAMSPSGDWVHER